VKTLNLRNQSLKKKSRGAGEGQRPALKRQLPKRAEEDPKVDLKRLNYPKAMLLMTVINHCLMTVPQKKNFLNPN